MDRTAHRSTLSEKQQETSSAAIARAEAALAEAESQVRSLEGKVVDMEGERDHLGRENTVVRSTLVDRETRLSELSTTHAEMRRQMDTENGKKRGVERVTSSYQISYMSEYG